MRGRRRLILLAAVVAAMLAAGTAAWAEPGATGELADARERLVASTREYLGTLGHLLALQKSAVERADAQARQRSDLYARGIVSRRELGDSEAALAAARAAADETERRMAEADALVGETLAAIELAKIPKAADSELVSTATVLRYQGPADLTAALVGDVERFFSGRFGRPLPVSARGQTAVHARLGLDHRRAIDVAIQPDSEEGKALVEYLKRQHIPFLAFRGAVPGASTGAHLHIGPISPPLGPQSATLR